MPSMMDRERPQSRRPEHLARRQKPPSNRMPLKRLPEPIRLH
jgi:hypothetical protein